MTAEDVIRLLELTPHPEGGHYRETWRAPAREGERAASTAIYYVLRAGEVSRRHRVDADEIWLWQAGGALALRISEDGKPEREVRLGGNFFKGEHPQAVVPRSAWQSARPLDAWTLVTCVVAPGFTFEGFELAEKDETLS